MLLLNELYTPLQKFIIYTGEPLLSIRCNMKIELIFNKFVKKNLYLYTSNIIRIINYVNQNFINNIFFAETVMFLLYYFLR